MTSDKDQLRAKLQAMPFLAIDIATGDARLATGMEILPLLGEKTHLIAHLAKALANFELITNQTEFSLDELSRVTGASYAMLYSWMRQGIIEPSIVPRRGAGRGCGPVFSFRDAYTAATIAALRRQRVTLDVMKQISPLLSGATNSVA